VIGLGYRGEGPLLAPPSIQPLTSLRPGYLDAVCLILGLLEASRLRYCCPTAAAPWKEQVAEPAHPRCTAEGRKKE